MGTPTLFGDSEDVAATVTRPPEHVVRELVALGLTEAGVRGMTDRQAFAVLRRKRQEAAASPARARSGGSAETGPPTPAAPPPPPPKADRGASTPERWASANELAAMLPGGEDCGIPWERRCDRLAAGLYVLSPVEWGDVVRGVVARLRADQPVTPEGPTMRCISLWQPWASLMAHGLKSVETRAWPTDYRGPLLIHAAKHWTGDLADLCHRDPVIRAALDEMGYPLASYAPGNKTVPVPKGMPFGAVVGRVELVECYRTEDVAHGPDGEVTASRNADGEADGPLVIGRTERAFGDYGPGRFAWLCMLAVRFAAPVEYRGRQGFFDVPEAVVADALARAGEPAK